MRTHKLVPVGGVAACLSGRGKVDGRAFCFLPLPISTKLPVHVHGYFALDNTNRRHLWKRQEDDERTRWNCQLLEFVVAPAYMSLLTWIRDFYIRENQWQIDIPDKRYTFAIYQLSTYQAFFPSEGFDDTWKELVKNTYRLIVASSMTDLFPVLRHKPIQNNWFVEWKSPLSVRDKSHQGFFNILSTYCSQTQLDTRLFGYGLGHNSEESKLKSILRRLGFPLLESPLRMIKWLEMAISSSKSDVKILTSTPSDVMSYLRQDPTINETLPAPVKDTEFHDINGVRCVIDFCKKDGKFQNELEGLPLLLTDDNILRKFSSKYRVHQSEFCGLFKDLSQKFLHKDLLNIFTSECSMFQKLDMALVAGLLRECAPYLQSVKYVKCDARLPLEWFVGLWDLLGRLSNEGFQKLHEQSIIQLLGDFSILPAIPTGSQWSSNRHDLRLVPAKLIPTVSRFQTNVLATLGAYALDKSFMEKVNPRTKGLILNLVANIDNPSSFIDVLLQCARTDISKFNHLTRQQHEDILLKFAGERNRDILRKLKQLPCFRTCSGTFVSVTEWNSYCVLPDIIPSTDQEAWMQNAIPVFLRYNPSLVTLYKNLGLSNVDNVIDIYACYILPAFSLLTEKARMEHMTILKRILEKMNKQQHSAAVNKLRLDTLPLISIATGELKRVSDLFDPHVEVFTKMLPPCSFPSQEYNYHWLPFLRNIGLNHVVTKSMFLGFAKDIEVLDVSPESQKDVKGKSMALVEHLWKDCNLHDDNFLKEVRDIKFLVCDEISKPLQALHPSKQEGCILTKYNGSTICRDVRLVWTYDNRLPQYAESRDCMYLCNKRRKHLDTALGVIEAPLLESVIKNTQNVCNRVKQRCEDNDRMEDHHVQAELMKVLDAIFAFYRKQCSTEGECKTNAVCNNCQLITNELRNVPVVFIEYDHELVQADRVSRSVRESLAPYVYQLPDRLGPTFWILTIMGATNEPTISQYAFILKSLYDSGNVGCNHPRLIKLVELATRGLVEELNRVTMSTIAASLTYLHLPSRNNTLEIASKLYESDFELFTDRLKSSDLPILKVFKGQESLAKEAFAKLPQELRPKPISGKVKEVLCGFGPDSRTCYLSEFAHCEFQDIFRTILQSQEFIDAIECIIRHCGVNVDVTTTQRFRQRFASLKVICMQNLRSILQVDDRTVENSESQVKCLITDKNELYMQHSEGDNTKFETVLAVSGQINILLENIIHRNELFVLPALLSQKSPKDIMQVLKTFNINANSLQDTSFELPPPGTKVPDAILHLIEQDMWIKFQPDDYVAYSKKDSDDELYVYARIVEHVRNNSICAAYLVDVGEEKPIEAHAVELYRIHIPKAVSGKDLVPFEGNPSDEHEQRSTPSASDIEKAKCLVTSEIKEIWKLPANQRRKAILRLMLKWHPDKHPEGPTSLYDETFKHIRHEMKRMEGNVSDRNAYEDIFAEASQRASNDQLRFSSFGGFSSGTWTGNFSDAHYFFKSASTGPDHPNARRWLRQANEDLRAAAHDLSPNDDKPSFEWVAYKCHQAVEKALKSAKLAISGQHDFSHNILGLAYGVHQQMNNVDGFMENVGKLASLVSDQGARYPDMCAYSSIPHDMYDDEDKAERACSLAKEIIDAVSMFVTLGK